LEWLLDQTMSTLIGLDLSPAFPFVDHDSYFPGAPDSPSDARALWAMVDAASAADPHLAVSSLLNDPEIRRHFRQHRDCGDLFPGGAGRMRVCEHGQRAMGLSPTSCFNLVGAAQVGKSSMTGMRVLHRLDGRVPIWPFDPLPPEGPVIVEIYTTIAARAAGIRKGLSKMRDAASLDLALANLGSQPHWPLARYLAPRQRGSPRTLDANSDDAAYCANRGLDLRRILKHWVATHRATPDARAGLAQLVERQFCKLDVAGSIPATGTISACLNHPSEPVCIRSRTSAAT
jgi:hypothetical protein